jgi:rod shape determining protein RodA
MRRAGGYGNRGLIKTIDWSLVICWLVLVIIGWANIYASVHASEPASIFDFSSRSGKQFVWMITALIIAVSILFIIPPRFYEGFSIPIYAMVIGLLVAVIFLGIEVKGSRSWFAFGPVRFQPAEISKIATSLLLAIFLQETAQFVYAALQIIGAVIAIRVYQRPGSPSYKLVWMCLLRSEERSGRERVYGLV